VTRIAVPAIAFAVAISCTQSPFRSSQQPDPAVRPREQSLAVTDPGDTADASVPSAAPFAPVTPPLPESPLPPLRPEPLEVPGFAPASHVGPSGEAQWPRPVVVVLHGNFDRPEWECDVWAEVASSRGFVLCPRGVRTPWASLKEDRWTYKGAARVEAEIEAGLAALEARYPGRVTRENMVLAGFSLGAILAPGPVESSPGKYKHLFLVEGGVEKLDRKRIEALRRAGLAGVGLAMSAPGRRRLANAAIAQLRAAGLQAIFVDMKGAGHAYSAQFGTTGAAALQALTADHAPGPGAQP
jgi:predicted esterase